MISENIVHFARVLRSAGMPIGPDRVLAAMAAVEHVGLFRREDVHAALGAVMLDRHEQQTIFDAAFDAFWRDPKLLEQLMYLLLPKISGRGDKAVQPRANRLAEALAAPRPPAAIKVSGIVQSISERAFSSSSSFAVSPFCSLTMSSWYFSSTPSAR